MEGCEATASQSRLRNGCAWRRGLSTLGVQIFDATLVARVVISDDIDIAGVERNDLCYPRLSFSLSWDTSSGVATRRVGPLAGHS